MSQAHSVTDKSASLLALIASGLHTHAEQATALTLGDRSQYIGLSDIGRALEWPCATRSFRDRIPIYPSCSPCNAATGWNTASGKPSRRKV